MILAVFGLDAGRPVTQKMVNIAAHRRPQWYGPITGQTVATDPPE